MMNLKKIKGRGSRRKVKIYKKVKIDRKRVLFVFFTLTIKLLNYYYNFNLTLILRCLQPAYLLLS